MILDHRADLYEACQRLCPIDPAYANLPIEQGFNWFSCLGDARFEGLYLVVFRSVRRAAADLALLEEHDDQAYAAVLEAGGLLLYFKGEVNGRRECLSFCLWERREQALSASGGATHRRAAQLSAEMYESYVLERYDLLKTGGSLVFRPLGGTSRHSVYPTSRSLAMSLAAPHLAQETTRQKGDDENIA
jgi:hypothetical protein